MNKYFLIFLLIILINLVLISKNKKDTVSKEEINMDPNKIEHDLKAFEYIKNKKYIVNSYLEKNKLILYYGLEKDWDNIKGGHSSSEPYYIYYKLPDDSYYIESIMVIGRYEGNGDIPCFAIVEDIYGRLVGKSEDFKYKDFSVSKFVLREFEVDMRSQPEEVVIKFYTFSDNENCFYIP